MHQGRRAVGEGAEGIGPRAADVEVEVDRRVFVVECEDAMPAVVVCGRLVDGGGGQGAALNGIDANLRNRGRRAGARRHGYECHVCGARPVDAAVREDAARVGVFVAACHALLQHVVGTLGALPRLGSRALGDDVHRTQGVVRVVDFDDARRTLRRHLEADGKAVVGLVPRLEVARPAEGTHAARRRGNEAVGVVGDRVEREARKQFHFPGEAALRERRALETVRPVLVEKSAVVGDVRPALDAAVVVETFCDGLRRKRRGPDFKVVHRAVHEFASLASAHEKFREVHPV